MENRRPPRSSSSGRKPYFDRSRNAPSYRGGKPSGDSRGNQQRRSDGAGDGRGNQQRRSDGVGDGRGHDRNRSGFDRRPGGGYRRDDSGGGYATRGRFGNRPPNNRDRSKAPKRPPVDESIKITSDAQVTDGKFRGRTLLNSDSPYAVPTPRKVREIAFKIISRRVKANRFLDLGCGVGTIGIEAISRGAMLATFVERSARGCSLLRKNLTAIGIKDGHGEVFEMEILPFLKKSARRRREWDLVYLGVQPGDECADLIDQLSRGSVIADGGLLLIEHMSTTTHPDNLNRLKRWRTLDQGETIVSIYERI